MAAAELVEMVVAGGGLELVLSRLQHPVTLTTTVEDDASLEALCETILGKILPKLGALAPTVDFPSAGKQARDAEIGLKIISKLYEGRSRPLRSCHLVSVVAFTNDSDYWTTPRAQQEARQIILSQLPQDHELRSFLVDAILEDFIRPLFSKSAIRGVTSSGRKDAFPVGASHQHQGEQRDPKKWKDVVYAQTIFAWAVREADADLIRTNWALFMPVLLALLDDTDTAIRKEALELLREFLVKVPAKTLRQTGLIQVVTEAVFPTLHALPSLTPENESAALLSAAYRALIILARYEESETSAARGSQLLGKVLREGILVGYQHAKEYRAVVDVLVVAISNVVKEMGINSVRYLKDLVPILSEVMMDPFFVGDPRCLIAAVAALQSLIANCWPRLSQTHHRNRVIQALVVCWINVTAEEGQGSADPESTALLKDSLTQAALMVSSVEEAVGEQLVKVVGSLTARENQLLPLFADGRQSAYKSPLHK